MISQAKTKVPLNVIWDMETSDPDDFLTLLLLLGHPMVKLKAVTIMPGSPHQVGLVREALSWFNDDIPLGSFNITHPNECVSHWHYKSYGNIEPSTEAEDAAQLILSLCDEQTTLITGGPLRNIANAIKLGNNTHKPLKAKEIVAQGGFAGEGVVPEEKQMKKFKGLNTAATYNLSHHKSARVVLEHHGIAKKRKRLLGKEKRIIFFHVGCKGKGWDTENAAAHISRCR
jgi:inosine-uridine nucleoside N-ribohydrolase